MNEKCNKNAKVKQLIEMVLSHKEEKGLIVIKGPLSIWTCLPKQITQVKIISLQIISPLATSWIANSGHMDWIPLFLLAIRIGALVNLDELTKKNLYYRFPGRENQFGSVFQNK